MSACFRYRILFSILLPVQCSQVDTIKTRMQTSVPAFVARAAHDRLHVTTTRHSYRSVFHALSDVGTALPLAIIHAHRSHRRKGSLDCTVACPSQVRKRRCRRDFSISVIAVGAIPSHAVYFGVYEALF